MRHLNERFPRLSQSLFPVISDVTNLNIQLGILGAHEAFELASLKTKIVFISIQLVSICLLACSVLQCVAACCSVLQCAAVCCIFFSLHSALQCGSVCCSVLQCSAVCCICLLVSQCVAVCCSVL